MNFMIQPHVSHGVAINYRIGFIKELEEQYHHEVNCILIILLVHGLGVIALFHLQNREDVICVVLFQRLID